MAKERKIYLLKDLPPEVKAVTFAKCSRSPKSFSEIAQELTEEKSAEFHEKWVVGYGHSSVAEHAVLSIALENVSILATKVIEDNRLASYTEKSTRYQVFDQNTYLKPKKIMNSSLADLYERTSDFLFETYVNLSAKAVELIKKKSPPSEKMSEKMYQTICKAKACDIIRYLLPTATLTNLGMTMNARCLEYAISKMLSHPLIEIQEIGEELKKVAQEEVPTLVKYAEVNPYFGETSQDLKKLTQALNFSALDQADSVTLVDYDQNAEDKVIAALLYRFSHASYEKIWERVKKMRPKEKEKVVDTALAKMGEHDRPLRELEHTYYTFDILIDYGAFRDIQRHRMVTQTNQEVTTQHGYAMPPAIEEFGLEKEFKECMEKSQSAFEKIYPQFPDEAQYIVCLAFKKRVLLTWNLRELYHFVRLRSGKKGHASYRKVAQEIYQEVKRVHPILAKYIRVDMG